MAAISLDAFDVVVVPFPFTDRNASKRRPALVLSNHFFNENSGHSVLAMITSAEQSSWPGDLSISDIESAGLTTDCIVRMKLFTLDDRLIVRKAGCLGAADRKKLQAAWKKLRVV